MPTTEVPEWVSSWFTALKPEPLSSVVEDPHSTALISTDMTAGFCREGALSSARVGALEEPVRSLFTRCYDAGVRTFALPQDTHHPETPEFRAWPVHCVAGTSESQMVPSLSSLPFADLFTIIPKNSLSPGFGSDFEPWLAKHEHIETAVVVGNCTDLCVYQLAMYLRLRANALNIHRFEVVVPADCVDTYDLSPETAASVGAFPHPGDFYHQVFLHHMALNGVRVVRSVIDA